MKKNKLWPLPLSAVFAAELSAETEQYALLSGHGKERTLEDLPELLQRHLRTCGFEGRESVVCCRMTWKNTMLKLKPGGRWMPTGFLQVNFVPRPARLVLMTARLFGLLKFGARDKYQQGKGSLLIRLLERFTLANEEGKKTDRAELVTLLAETMILPVYALQRYTEWEQLDARTVKGTITDGRTLASGLFHFDDQGLFSSFTTDDRYYADNGQYHAYKWTAAVSHYIRRSDLLFPSKFRATWHRPEGDHEYFRGELSKLEFNSTALADSLRGPGAAPKINMREAEQQQDGVQLVQHRDQQIRRGSAQPQCRDTKGSLDDQKDQRVAS